MPQTLDPAFRAALRRELVAMPTARPRHRRRPVLVATGVLGAVGLGGAVAVAGLRPAGEVADPPLSRPVILNGVGPATVPLPPAPANAEYARLELTCFDGTRCNTPGGGVEGPGARTDRRYNAVQRDALPLTGESDPTNAQRLPRFDPAVGVPVDVARGTHWRLYVVYTDGLNAAAAPLGDGRTSGIPSNTVLPDLIPAVATNGRVGWVDYRLLTDLAKPRLTATGTSQTPLPVYADDGTTVIGEADVSRAYRP